MSFAYDSPRRDHELFVGTEALSIRLVSPARTVGIPSRSHANAVGQSSAAHKNSGLILPASSANPGSGRQRHAATSRSWSGPGNSRRPSPQQHVATSCCSSDKRLSRARRGNAGDAGCSHRARRSIGRARNLTRCGRIASALRPLAERCLLASAERKRCEPLACSGQCRSATVQFRFERTARALDRRPVPNVYVCTDPGSARSGPANRPCAGDHAASPFPCRGQGSVWFAGTFGIAIRRRGSRSGRRWPGTAVAEPMLPEVSGIGYLRPGPAGAPRRTGSTAGRRGLTSRRLDRS